MANVLANIFGSSPVKPLEKHIDLAYRCARKLHDFFAASVKGDWVTAAAVRDEIETLEHEADEEGDSSASAEEPVHAGPARRPS